MRIFFQLVALAGLIYLIFLILFHQNNKKLINRWRMQLNPQKVMNRFHSEQMEILFQDAGFKNISRNINFYRWMLVLAYLILSITVELARGNSIGFTPFIVAASAIFITSPLNYAPAGYVLRKVKQQNIIRKDSEIISFLKLYENNRMNENHYIQFESFCMQMAPHFRFIRKELMQLSERVIDDGLERALDWWVELYPSDHKFISEIRTVLLTTESLDDKSKVLVYLKEQGKIINKISSDQYLRRWTLIGDIAGIFNSIPSLGTFIMIIWLVLLYLNILKSNVSIIQ